MMEIVTTEDILFFAFRYALGRRTAAVSIVAGELINNANRLTPSTRLQVVKEIDEMSTQDGLGAACDRENWEQVRQALISLGTQKEEA
jgi:hypothetical protein